MPAKRQKSASTPTARPSAAGASRTSAAAAASVFSAIRCHQLQCPSTISFLLSDSHSHFSKKMIPQNYRNGNFEKVNEQFAVRTINNLLKKLGLDTVKGGKNSARRYSISEAAWQTMATYAENRKRQKINVLDLNKEAKVFNFMPDDQITEILSNWDKTA